MKHKFQNPLLAHIVKQIIAQDIALQEPTVDPWPDRITVEQFASEVGVELDLHKVQQLRAQALKLSKRAGLPCDDYVPRPILASIFRQFLLEQ